jgi:hypothetical protein
MPLAGPRIFIDLDIVRGTYSMPVRGKGVGHGGFR